MTLRDDAVFVTFFPPTMGIFTPRDYSSRFNHEDTKDTNSATPNLNFDAALVLCRVPWCRFSWSTPKVMQAAGPLGSLLDRRAR